MAALEKAGYRVVERNVRLRIGELDAVAWDGDIFVFVEVRSRANARFGGGILAVSPAKQRQIARVAAAYVALRPIAPAPRGMRFDVVAVTGDDLVIIRDAFRLS
ncbi:MAG: YraN family protein [Myxococcales bacterium]|nr:YraN family protein [Myxococcales bacterium]